MLTNPSFLTTCNKLVHDEDIEPPPSQAITPSATSPLDDPLKHMTGPMKRSRTKKIKDALTTLILEVQANSIIYSQSLGLGKAINILSVTSELPRHPF